MFLDATLQYNKNLINSALFLHQNYEIEPNTYVIDVDVIKKNVSVLVENARKYNIRLLAMTKQLGRNPVLGKIIADEGIDAFVVVDPWEAETLGDFGLKLGNVGHIVQIPQCMLEKILKFEPEYVTVYGYENARLISEFCRKKGLEQKLILKIDDSKNTSYPGQEGGIEVTSVLETANRISTLSNVTISGITAFPCVLYDNEKNVFKFTDKVDTLKYARSVLKSNGFSIDVINVPSANTSASFEMISQIGGNLLEPGHAISGTTPIHAYSIQPETPAIVYVSEISHLAFGNAYVYGGGNYARGLVKEAVAGKNTESFYERRYKFQFPSSENIDYYAKLSGDGINTLNIGDTVIAAFRTQIFVTRAHVALVEGIQAGLPKILGIFDSQGKLLKEG